MKKSIKGLCLLMVAGLPLTTMAADDDSAEITVNASVVADCSLVVSKNTVNFNNLHNHSGIVLNGQADSVTVTTTCNGTQGVLTIDADNADGKAMLLTKSGGNETFEVGVKIGDTDANFESNKISKNVTSGSVATQILFTPTTAQDPVPGNYSGRLSLKIEPK